MNRGATCRSGKVAYASPGEAARVARKLASHAKPGPLHVGKMTHYRCPMCSAWHVGHNIQQGKRA